MKRSIVLALLVMLTSSFNVLAQDTGNPSVAGQEWRSYIEPLLPIGERGMALMSNPQDPQLRQEYYRLLFSEISLAYMGGFLGDAEHPDFWPIFNQAFNYGFPNPDDSYYLAPIEGSGVYKISGFRGTVRDVDFQIGAGPFFPQGGSKASPRLVNYTLDHVHIKKDGSFEVLLSSERPSGYKGDWWKLDPSATNVMVRQLSYDWLHEVDGRFAIERLDRPAIKPRLSAQEIEENLRNIPVWAENWTNMLIKLKLRDTGQVNTIALYDFAAVGGATSQKYLQGKFEINPDEALIYETEIPKQCRYWSVQLTDMTWSAVDWMNRQSSLNGYFAKLDKDGKFRAVISATDPGVPNWLDTAGYAKGFMFGRWRDCSGAPVPTITKVKLAEVRKYLPADTPVVSAEQRDAAIRLRRKGAQLRRRW